VTDTTTCSPYAIKDSSTYVRIRYSVRVENGPFIKGAGEPALMDFVTGYAQVIPGLERRLMGHSEGDKLSFTVPAEEAFGVRHEELVFEKPREDFHFPPGMAPFPGMELPLVTMGEGPDSAIIREVRAETIVIDCNHPLGGKSLRYDLEIVEARPAGPTDVCSEWQERDNTQTCGCAPKEFVLGLPPEGDEHLS